MARIMFSSGSRAWANNLNDLRERWKLRREEPVNFIVPVSLFKKDLEKLTRDQLLKIKLELLEFLDRAKKELYKRQTQAREYDMYMEANAFKDLQSTVRSVSFHIQEVNHALGKTKKLSFPQVFIDVSSEKLSKETFDDIMEAAHERLNNA